MNKNYIKKINEKFSKFAEWALDHRLIVVIICIIASIVATTFSLDLIIDNSMDAYFLEDDPTFVYYKSYMQEYGNDEFLYIVYNNKNGINNLQTLKDTKKLVEDIKEVPFVEKVNAITNIEFMEGSKNGDLKIYELMEKFPANQKEADRLIEKLLDRPVYVDSLITSDSNYAAILCEMADKPKGDPNYFNKIGESLDKVLAKSDYKDFQFWPVGDPVLNYEYNKVLEEDANLLSGLSLIMILALLALFFRQLKGAIGPIVIVIFALSIVLGFMGIMDFTITAMFDMTPSLIIAVGVATTVHLLNEYRNHLIAGNDNRTSIINAVKMVGFPCLFTSITTAVGFGSLTISPIRAIRDYGQYTIIGVIAIFVFSFTLLLVILSVAGKKTEKHFQKESRKEKALKGQGQIDWLMPRISNLNKKNYGKILLVSLVLIIIAVYGMTKLEINSSWLEEIGDRIQIYHDYKFVDRTIGGSGNFEILLNSKEPDGVKNFQFVKTLEKIQNYADKQKYLVNKTTSLVDIIKEVNRSLHNNDKSYYKLPSTDEEISQYILLYEVSGGEELEKILSADIATARLTIYIKSSDSKTSKIFYNDLIKYIDEVAVKPFGYSYNVTGVSYLTLETMSYIGETQITSIMLALVFISIMMTFVFRSVKIGFISMIPNVFPIIITLGFMGLAGIWLDFVRSLIACIAIGLAVDDTIHFISRYSYEFIRLGNYEKALDAAMEDVGRAITVTTFVLVIGFSVTLFSKLNDVYYFGLLASMCIWIALLADYFIAPALILMFKPFGKEFTPSTDAVLETAAEE